MQTFDFNLPEALIARRPQKNRGQSKMLVYNKQNQDIVHKTALDLGEFLNPGDLLIFNDAKVLQSRFEWQFKNKMKELVFIQCHKTFEDHSIWKVILSGKKVPKGHAFQLGTYECELLERLDNSLSMIKINANESSVLSMMQGLGKLPIPPYIRKMRQKMGESTEHPLDPSHYQSDFAKDSNAVAAPTAGLHFDKIQIKGLRQKGVLVEFLRLDVGWGTFEPLNEEHFKNNKLHEEFIVMHEKINREIIACKKRNNKVVAVGTTCIRSLEWWYQQGMPEKSVQGNCDLFLYHPWTSNVADALITNFHFPNTSLLHLVSAFIGDNKQTELMRIYNEAIAKEYLFFSYGDCMLIY